jgi:hypothetical protein
MEKMKMPAISITTRKQLEAQGFVGLDDNTLAQANYPLRLAPALCMAWVALGTYLASPAACRAL